VIRVRPLDVRGLIEETYELLRSGDWDRLGREGVEFSKRFTWDGVAKVEWKALERIVENTNSFSCKEMLTFSYHLQ
jgi:hypothetical protein